MDPFIEAKQNYSKHKPYNALQDHLTYAPELIKCQKKSTVKGLTGLSKSQPK